MTRQPRKDDGVLGGKGRKEEPQPRSSDAVQGGNMSEEGRRRLEAERDVRVFMEAHGCDEKMARRCIDDDIKAAADGLPGAGFVTRAERDARKRLYGSEKRCTRDDDDYELTMEDMGW